jgi:uncharacterized protein YcfJ
MSRQMMIGGIIGALAVSAVGVVAGFQMYGPGNDAEVLSVKPAMVDVTVPREECHDQVVSVVNQSKDPKQITGTVAGIVIGGVLGNQVGGGKGKDIATVAGAAAGGYAGNQIQEKMQEGNTHEETQRVCKTVNDVHQEARGYDVTYRLDGQERTVHMDHDPGSRLEVKDGQVVLNP